MPTFWQKFLKRLDKIDQERLERYLKGLSEERGFYRSVFQSISDAVIVLDNEGRVDFINDAAKEMLGLTPMNLINKPLIRYLGDPELIRLLEEKISSRDSATAAEIEVYHPRHRLLDIKLIPRRTDESTIGLVIVIRDITAEKQRQAETLQAEKLEALSTLAAGVAHEVGNPLNSLGIHMQLLSREVEQLPEARQKKLLKSVKVAQDEIKRLDRTIRHFLSVVRPTKRNIEEININQLLENVLDFMYYEISGQNVAIVKKFETNMPRALLDQHQLRQAFFNIIKNAIQAMPNGGVLEVTTAVDGNDMVIVFADDGVGIPKNKLNKVFDPYYTTKDSGSGLGLMIVYKIVKDHRGNIEIESEPGKGTKVRVTLPIFERKIGLITDRTASREGGLVT